VGFGRQHELKEAEIDDGVCAVTNLKKKSIVPKIFSAVAFSKSRTPEPRYASHVFQLNVFDL
jgi:hypothetical protein